MEAPSSREHYAEREVLFNAKQSELGKVLNKGSKEYDRLLAEVDAELLAMPGRASALRQDPTTADGRGAHGTGTNPVWAL